MGSLPPIREHCFSIPETGYVYSFSPEGMSVYNSILPQEGQNAAFTFSGRFLFDRDQAKEYTVFNLDLVIQNHFSMTNGTVHKTPTS